MTGLCKYKDIFGKPGAGVHSYRIFNIAIIDFVATAIVAYMITLLFKIPFVYSFLGLFLTGIFMHHLFCVRTTIGKLLFS